MKESFSHSNITFSLEGIEIHTPNILFECFTNTIPSHSHGAGCYEIHYIPSGYGKLQADGTYYDIIPNTLYVTGPHIEHAQTPLLQDPMQEYCIYLKIDKLSRDKSPSSLVALFTSKPFWIGQDNQNIHSLFLRLFSELDHQYTGYHEQVKALLSQILICMIRNYEQKKDTSKTVVPNHSANNKSLIIEEYFLYEYKNLSLDGLAKRLFLSTRQTQRLLREYYNKSFQEKKTEARMSAAAILVADTNRSIVSIADALGYASPEQFSTAFRNYYHASPTAFRKNLSDTGNVK